MVDYVRVELQISEFSHWIFNGSGLIHFVSYPYSKNYKHATLFYRIYLYTNHAEPHYS